MARVKKRVNKTKKTLSKKWVWLIILLSLGTLYGLYTLYQFLSAGQKNGHYEFQLSEKAIGNPLMGFAPSAEEEELSSDIHLVYVDITWRELEPQKGQYNWEQIESDNQFSRWRKEGKQVVLRFVLDYPGQSQHKDIPDWLSEEITDLGDVYNTSYGQGFSPNYEDKTLRAYYQQAVTAMGKRWGDDEFIANIELGALGHWGEWHVHENAGIRQLPNKTVRQDYIRPFVESFPKAHLLFRRPFDTGLEGNFGLYNDVFGDKTATQEWLGWIKSGGSYNQTGESRALIAMPNAWQKAPIGGELTSSTTMKNLLGHQRSELISELKAAHVSFLGPKIAEDIGDDKEAYNHVLKEMGYRFWVSSLNLKRSHSTLKVTLNLENEGNAPFYRDWPLVVYLCDEKGKVVQKQQTSVKLSELLPDESLKVKAQFDLDGKEQYQIKLGIESPITNRPAVHFAMEGLEDEVMPLLVRGQ